MQTASYKTTERLRQILVIAATAGVIFFNYLAAAGFINNTTPGEVSDRYLNFLTPADYAFGIWGLIYLGLAAFSIYQALPAQATNFRLASIRTLYIANCAANIGWLYFWHHDRIFASLAVIFIMLLTLVLINRNLHLKERISNAEKWLVDLPFNIYFGWVTAAAIINFMVALIYAGVKMSNSTASVLAAILIGVSVISAFLVRCAFGSAAYPLAIAWALAAIAVKQQSNTMVFVAAILGTLAAIASALWKRKTNLNV